MGFVGLVIPADASKPVYRERFGDDGKRPAEIVGGYIEGIQGPLGIGGYCNEDGKRLGLPLNRRATNFFLVASPFGPGYDPIVGDVIVFDNLRPAIETADEGDAPEWLDDRI